RKCLHPAQCTETPLVACLQSWKTPFRPRRTEIVAGTLAERQKLFRHDCAHHMGTHVFRTRLAATVPKKTRYRIEGTGDQRLTEHISGWRRFDFHDYLAN